MEYDIKALKASSLIKQKEPDLFSVRVRAVGVRVEATRLKALAEPAETIQQDPRTVNYRIYNEYGQYKGEI